MRRYAVRLLLWPLLVITGLILPLAAQTAVWTYHNNNARTGANTAETALTPANVNVQEFGLILRAPVDGAIYAQPLYVPDVQLPNGQTRNLVLVATEGDSVYAFDAQGASDGAGATPVWVDHFADPSQGIDPQTSNEAHCQDLAPWIGITGTPVIDLSTHTLYVVAATMVNGQAEQSLHALDLATGAEKFGGPAVVAATVPGTGVGSANGKLSFNPLLELQRPGLLLSQGLVYVAWGSHCDYQPYHGWLMAFNAATLQLAGAMATTPNGEGGGIWGGAPAADAAGAVYVSSGNLGFDPATGDLGESIIKAQDQNGQLAATDYFAPYDVNSLSAENEDISSEGVVVLPALPGETAPEAVAGDKAGDLFVLNRDNLGGYIEGPGPDTQIVQEMAQASAGVFGTPAYWNGYWYQLGTGGNGGLGDTLQAFRFSNGLLSAAPVAQSSQWFHFPAGVPAISANGDSDGIVWLVQADAWASGGPEVLHAYNAETLQELYNSGQNAARDQAGTAVKFAAPAIADGEVFVPADGELDIYGLLPAEFSIAATAQNSTIALGSVATITIATSGSGTDIELGCGTPASGCSFSPAAVAPGGAATLNVAASALTAGANTITITASQGTVSHSSSVTITAQGFTLSATPASRSVLSGQPAVFQISAVAQGGLSSPIALACDAGSADCQVAPSSITPGQSSTITLTQLPAGAVTDAKVSGSSGIGARATVALTATAWDFSVLAAASQATVPRGTDTAQFTLASAGLAGFTGSIALSCAPATPLACSFSPATINAGDSSTLTVHGLARATGNPIPLTVQATSGGDTHTVPLSIAISDFSLTVADSGATINPGQTASVTVTTTSLGWLGGPPLPPDGGAPWSMGGLGLLALGLISLGLAAAIATGRRRVATALGCVLLTLCLAACGGGGQPAAGPVQKSTPRGTSTLTITATAGTLVHTQTLTLNIN